LSIPSRNAPTMHAPSPGGFRGEVEVLGHVSPFPADVPVVAFAVLPSRPLEHAGEHEHGRRLAQELLAHAGDHQVTGDRAGAYRLEGLRPDVDVVQAGVDALDPADRHVGFDRVQRAG